MKRLTIEDYQNRIKRDRSMLKELSDEYDDLIYKRDSYSVSRKGSLRRKYAEIKKRIEYSEDRIKRLERVNYNSAIVDWLS